MHISKAIFVLVLIILNTYNVVTAQTVYRWVDEDGQVHFGSKAESDKAEEIKIKIINNGSSGKDGIIKKQKRFLDALDAEKKSIAEEKKKQQEQEEKNILRCEASRNQLKRMEHSSALYDRDNKGNRILLNNKQYEQAMKQARARVEKWCN